MKITVTTHVTIEQVAGQTTTLVETREFSVGDNPLFIPREMNQAMQITGLPLLDMAKNRWLPDNRDRLLGSDRLAHDDRG